MNGAEGFPVIRLAAAQAAPVFLNREATVEKACELIREAGRHGADIIGFPEGFIPAHPVWYYHFPGMSLASLSFAERLFHNSVEVPSPAVDALCAAAAEANTHVVMGMCERRPGTAGTMWNSQLHISRSGQVLGTHQKLVPTTAERLVHVPGSGAGMRTFESHFGPVGGLICGENSNPLAINALIQEQIRVHVSSWPNYFAPSWPPGMAETGVLTGRSIAYMAKCFVINACGTVDPQTADVLAQTDEHRRFLADPKNLGGSTIIAPTGQVIAGPAGPGDEILYADGDLSQVVRSKLVHDFAGHYQRSDVFSFATLPSDPHVPAGYPSSALAAGGFRERTTHAIRGRDDVGLSATQSRQPRAIEGAEHADDSVDRSALPSDS
jgi:aliphatic nitrilase